MAYTNIDGTVKHKSLYLIWFWCIFAVLSVVIAIIAAVIAPESTFIGMIPLTQIVGFAGGATTLYIGADKAKSTITAKYDASYKGSPK